MAAMGWCQQSDGQSGGGDAAAGGQSGGNFEMSGGAGSSGNGPADQNGGSPGVSLAAMGFQPSFTYLFRGRYNIPSTWDVRLTGDLVRASYTGNSDNYQGPLHTSFPQGASLSGSMTVTLLQASADLGLGKGSYGNAHFKIGPRLQWTMYSDTFRATATWGGASADLAGANGCSMYGIGFAGAIDVSRYTGAVLPTVQFSAAVGGGKSMRYRQWELSVDVVRTSLDEYAYGRRVKAGATVGLMGQYFDESTSSGSVPGVAAEENLHFSMFVPFVQGFVTF